ncbi:hypothetical protein KFK09_011142 [Dendrobium nobile]|uniref:Uncharacterized protein n=1 Tax=Dendrobium nobile TaxID=94219 RepID=A0A8T3BHH5_DENNO|nr:hypothetical protein KFK09_011142 [Dendrobium nobile]
MLFMLLCLMPNFPSSNDLSGLLQFFVNNLGGNLRVSKIWDPLEGRLGFSELQNGILGSHEAKINRFSRIYYHLESDFLGQIKNKKLSRLLHWTSSKFGLREI